VLRKHPFLLFASLQDAALLERQPELPWG
jgi:hypothetical protein